MVTETRPSTGTVAGTVSGIAESDLVLARFRTTAALDVALHALETAGFNREDVALPDLDPPIERATPEAASKPADTDVEAQQARVFHSAVGGSFAALMAATAVAATGGVAAAVAGAAIGTGAAVAGLAHLVSRALSHSEQLDRERRAAEGRLFLAVRAATPERRARALQILRDASAEPVEAAAQGQAATPLTAS